MMPTTGGAIIQVAISDQETLFSSYMPFVSGGGIFIPSKQSVSLGQELLVIVTLFEHTQKYPLTGKVIWISPRQNALKPQGFGIQFSGEKSIVFKNEVERLLAGKLSLEHPTYTM